MTEPDDRVRKAYVEPTNACNLDCRTCVRHSWDEHEGFMEWPVYERVVDGLAAPATIAFMGLGEPLLHPRLVDMVRLATACGLATEITTNALLLDEVMAERSSPLASASSSSASTAPRRRPSATCGPGPRWPPSSATCSTCGTSASSSMGRACASASSSWRCAAPSPSCRASTAWRRSSAPRSSSSATSSPTRRSWSRRRSTTARRRPARRHPAPPRRTGTCRRSTGTSPSARSSDRPSSMRRV